MTGTISCFPNIHFPLPFSYSGRTTSHCRGWICRIPISEYSLALKKLVCDSHFFGQWNMREFGQGRFFFIIKRKMKINASSSSSSHVFCCFSAYAIWSCCSHIANKMGRHYKTEDAEDDRAERQKKVIALMRILNHCTK